MILACDGLLLVVFTGNFKISGVVVIVLLAPLVERSFLGLLIKYVVVVSPADFLCGAASFR